MLNMITLDDMELRNFVKVMHEARFPDCDSDPAIMFSSYATNWHSDAVDEQERRMRVAGDERGLVSQEQWRQWRGRPEEDLLIERMRVYPSRRRWLLQATSDEIRSVLRPFVLDDATLDVLLSHARRLEEEDVR